MRPTAAPRRSCPSPARRSRQRPGAARPEQGVDLLAVDLAVAQPAQDHALRVAEPALQRRPRAAACGPRSRGTSSSSGGQRDQLVDALRAGAADQLLHARLAAARVGDGQVARGVVVDEAQEAVEVAVELLEGGQLGVALEVLVHLAPASGPARPGGSRSWWGSSGRGGPSTRPRRTRSPRSRRRRSRGGRAGPRQRCSRCSRRSSLSGAGSRGETTLLIKGARLPSIGSVERPVN